MEEKTQNSCIDHEYWFKAEEKYFAIKLAKIDNKDWGIRIEEFWKTRRFSVTVQRETAKWIITTIKSIELLWRSTGKRKFFWRETTAEGRKITMEMMENRYGEYLKIVCEYEGVTNRGGGGIICIPADRGFSGWKDCAYFLQKVMSTDKPFTKITTSEGFPSISVDFSEGRKRFGSWERGLICDVKGNVDDWRVIGKIVYEEMRFEGSWEFFPFDDGKAYVRRSIRAMSNDDVQVLCQKLKCIEREGMEIYLYPWNPIVNSSRTEVDRAGIWVSIKGLPFHWWSESTMNSIGEVCGGIVEIDERTRNATDLSAARIKVKGEPNQIPRQMRVVDDRVEYIIDLFCSPEVSNDGILMTSIKITNEDMKSVKAKGSWVFNGSGSRAPCAGKEIKLVRRGKLFELNNNDQWVHEENLELMIDNEGMKSRHEYIESDDNSHGVTKTSKGCRFLKNFFGLPLSC